MDVDNLRYARHTLRFVEDELRRLTKIADTPPAIGAHFREMKRLLFSVRQLIELDLQKATKSGPGRINHKHESDK
jgi:hypothetical protein